MYQLCNTSSIDFFFWNIICLPYFIVYNSNEITSHLKLNQQQQQKENFQFYVFILEAVCFIDCGYTTYYNK